MKRKKTYIILVILAVVSLFSFSGLCNQSGQSTEVNVEVVGNENSVENGDTSNNQEEGDIVDIENEAPAITLAVYEGPIYLAADEQCYWRIEANVSGNPTPDVEFNRDDSGGSLGPNKVQVNLGDPSETFVLTATATNSEGSASHSITLDWGCEEENEDFEFEISTATEEMYQPIVVYDFYEEAPYARWEHASHVIDWDEDWYAGQAWVSCVASSWFEDGAKHFRVLNTVTGEDECQLIGIFPNLSENITIPAEARFKAKVGFLVTSTTAGVLFRIRFFDGSNWYKFPDGYGIQCENDGVLDILDIDLSSIAGKSGKISLEVAPDDCSRECRIAWINPRIVK